MSAVKMLCELCFPTEQTCSGAAAAVLGLSDGSVTPVAALSTPCQLMRRTHAVQCSARQWSGTRSEHNRPALFSCCSGAEGRTAAWTALSSGCSHMSRATLVAPQFQCLGRCRALQESLHCSLDCTLQWLQESLQQSGVHQQGSCL